MDKKNTALIVGVGASNGLGAASARRFAREGLHVVVAGRTAEKVERIVAEIRDSGGSAEAVTGDASVEEDAIRFVETAEAKGPLALVLQNSGNNQRDLFLELAVDDFEALWREHCRAGFLTGRESARRMLPAAVAAPSCLLVHQDHCAERPCMRRSLQRRQVCGQSRKAWRESSAPKVFMSRTSSSMVVFPAIALNPDFRTWRASVAKMACCRSMRSQKLTGNCICSTVAPGHLSRICVLG